MALHNRKSLKKRRQQLRNNCTRAEARLWFYLKESKLKGRKFRRQHSIGPFIVDFYCPEERLIIELDGAIHEMRQDYDASRTRFLESYGFRVIRFENRDIFEIPQAVLDAITSHYNI